MGMLPPIKPKQTFEPASPMPSDSPSSTATRAAAVATHCITQPSISTTTENLPDGSTETTEKIRNPDGSSEIKKKITKRLKNGEINTETTRTQQPVQPFANFDWTHPGWNNHEIIPLKNLQ
jgi:hypothetical protein